MSSDSDGGLDAGKKKDSGVHKPKDAGTGSADASAQDAAADMDGNVIVYRDAGDAGCYGCTAPTIPVDWTCPASYWGDKICDCGCGAYDFDCTGNSCDTAGCVLSSCDSCLTDKLAWKECAPDPDPSAWTCDRTALNDSNCDCGCGYPDPACHGSGCSEPGCWRNVCDVRHDSTGAMLPTSSPPFAWTCPKAEWGDGHCDCGCGDYDPDCSSTGTPAGCTSAACVANVCEFCHDKDGRALPHCNVLLDPNVANGWTCDPWRFNAGDGCDCGCGVADPDCSGGGCSGYACSSTTGCVRCTASDFPNDELVGCLPSSGGGSWTCDKHHYGTGDGCDCGCGLPDPDCGAAANGCTTAGCTDPGKCDYCHVGATDAIGDYTPCKPTPTTGWSCGTTSAPAWANQECDCGCGKPDPWCRIKDRKSCTAPGCQTAVCQFCNDAAGTRAACTGPRWNELSTCEAAVYGADGKCDCGCGAIDPDCPKDQGCAEPGCGLNGCTICHASGGVMEVCQFWTCPAGTDKNGVCDCGCGGPDPECASLLKQGCVEPGCTTADCQAWHDPYGRPVHAP